MTPQKRAMSSFEQWYDGLEKYRANNGFPAKATLGASVFILERLKGDFDLRIDHHLTPKGGQVAVTYQKVRNVLAHFGETRELAREYRTNRGLLDDIRSMLEALAVANIAGLPAEQRNQILVDLQEYMIRQIRMFHNQERLKIGFDRTKTTWQAIQNLLKTAADSAKEGCVAQHLVGAKLQLRFPELKIDNFSCSTADVQLGRPGDFYVGDTAFHVTVAPMQGVYEKCKRNLQDGRRAYLLVPARILEGTRQLAEQVAEGQIGVESIESFVSQNIEELSEFSGNRRLNGLRRLLEEYNRRVDEVELDKSLLLEIPYGMQNHVYS